MSNTINSVSNNAVPNNLAAENTPLPSAKGLTKAFGNRDTNNDNTLTRADFANGKVPPGLLKKFDTNNDGAVSLAEFLNRGHHGGQAQQGDSTPQT